MEGTTEKMKIKIGEGWRMYINTRNQYLALEDNRSGLVKLGEKETKLNIPKIITLNRKFCFETASLIAISHDLAISEEDSYNKIYLRGVCYKFRQVALATYELKLKPGYYIVFDSKKRSIYFINRQKKRAMTYFGSFLPFLSFLKGEEECCETAFILAKCHGLSAYKISNNNLLI